VLFLVGPAKDVKRLSRGKSHSPLTVGTTPGRRRESNGSRGKEGTLPANQQPLIRRTTQIHNAVLISEIKYRNTQKIVMKKKDFISHRKEKHFPVIVRG
jgi:hypothetical protein